MTSPGVIPNCRTMASKLVRSSQAIWMTRSISPLESSACFTRFIASSELDMLLPSPMDRNRAHSLTEDSTVAHKKLNLPEKECLHCKRMFAWRKKWEKVWGQVRYCSDRCRQASAADSRVGGSSNGAGHIPEGTLRSESITPRP